MKKEIIKIKIKANKKKVCHQLLQKFKKNLKNQILFNLLRLILKKILKN